MIAKGTRSKKDVNTTDPIIKDLTYFQHFLARHFNNHPQYESMRPYCNPPGRFFAKTKTHKANSINDLNMKYFELRSIIGQVNTCYYNAGQVLAEYLKSLAKSIKRSKTLNFFHKY